MKDIIEDDKNALYDKVKDNSFDFQNQLKYQPIHVDTKSHQDQSLVYHQSSGSGLLLRYLFYIHILLCIVKYIIC